MVGGPRLASHAPRSVGVGLVGRLVIVVVLALGALVGGVASAFADEPGETTEGYLLVEQALGHLAHDASPTGIEIAVEKVNDALATKDQEGVDVQGLTQGKDALEAGRVDEAQTLLQASIKEALQGLSPARGNETGTTLVVPEQPGRTALAGLDWGFLVTSVAALLLGFGLAVRFRPHDSVKELRQRLGPPGPASTTRDAGRHR